MKNLHVNQNQSRLLIVNYGYNNNNIHYNLELKLDEKGNLFCLVLQFLTQVYDRFMYLNIY